MEIKEVDDQVRSDIRPAKYSNARNPMRFFFAYACSFGLYYYWWAYVNWVQLKAHRKLGYNPMVRIACLLIPVLGLYFVRLHFRDINAAAKEAGTKIYADDDWLMAGSIMFDIAAAYFLGLARQDAGAFLFVLLCVYLSAYVVFRAQATLNVFWQETQPGLAVNTAGTLGEFVSIMIGGMVQILLLLIAVAAIQAR